MVLRFYELIGRLVGSRLRRDELVRITMWA